MNRKKKPGDNDAEDRGDRAAGKHPTDGFFSTLDMEFLVHEMKDPLSIVENTVAMMLDKPDRYGPLTEKQEKALGRILRNSRKLRAMVFDLLEVGRSEAGYCIMSDFQPIPAVHRTLLEALEVTTGSISEVLRQTTNEVQIAQHLRAMDIHLDITKAARDATLHQDEDKFCQIVGNLLKNALHHRSSRMAIAADIADGRFRLSVTDDGPGIAAEHHEAVFQRYTQLDAFRALERRGHGLGLAGSRFLSRCLGGNIELESRKGTGATFRLVLPVSMTAGTP